MPIAAAAPAPIEAARSQAVNSRAFSPHPDNDHDRTQVRGDSSVPVTVAILRIRIDDGREVESVLIPDGERRTLCVSTQVGCPVACPFCASGLLGLSILALVLAI